MSIRVTSDIPNWTDLLIPLPEHSTVADLKQAIAVRLNIPTHLLILQANGHELLNQTPISTLTTPTVHLGYQLSI